MHNCDIFFVGKHFHLDEPKSDIPKEKYTRDKLAPVNMSEEPVCLIIALTNCED